MQDLSLTFEMTNWPKHEFSHSLSLEMTNMNDLGREQMPPGEEEVGSGSRFNFNVSSGSY